MKKLLTSCIAATLLMYSISGFAQGCPANYQIGKTGDCGVNSNKEFALGYDSQGWITCNYCVSSPQLASLNGNVAITINHKQGPNNCGVQTSSSTTVNANSKQGFIQFYYCQDYYANATTTISFDNMPNSTLHMRCQVGGSSPISC